MVMISLKFESHTLLVSCFPYQRIKGSMACSKIDIHNASYRKGTANVCSRFYIK